MSNFRSPKPNPEFALRGTEGALVDSGRPAGRAPAGTPARPLFLPRAAAGSADQRGGLAIEMKLVNRIRERVKAWREQRLCGRDADDARTAPVVAARRAASSGCSSPRSRRWRRSFFSPKRGPISARASEIPRDEPSDDRKSRGLHRVCPLRLQDGHRLGQDHRHGHAGRLEHPEQGNDRSDARFSDVVLVVCPT